jgi:osmotically-inducible protein OsmY
MFPEQIPRTDPGELIRCRESSQSMLESQMEDNKSTKADTAMAHEVDNALWKDATFRATDYDHISVRVIGRIVYLFGHVISLTNQHRAERALQSIPHLLGVNNYLIPDDQLLAEVSSALGSLEHAYNCKFFTGVSHGVVLLSGNVNDAKLILLAEKCASSNPNVRGVINSVRIEGGDLDLQNPPFLQPIIGEEIFFLNGVSGLVKQVIINPDNRCVIAMTVQGQFTDQRQELKSFNNGEARPPERLIVISMNSIRYLTRDSGFLYINSDDRERVENFEPALFRMPDLGWVPPYPYCTKEVLFPFDYQAVDYEVVTGHQLLREQLPANDSLGG